ncbi:hypothetical protein BGZ65_008446, partial [Modicella reniformis]
TIQATSRIDDCPRDVRAPITVVFGDSRQQHQQQDQEDVAEVDIGDVVDGADDNVGGPFNSAAMQAVVQSGRNDVESEPLLFLGGLPVSLWRPVRADSTAVSSNATQSRSSEQQHQQQRQGSPGSEEEVDDTFIRH